MYERYNIKIGILAPVFLLLAILSLSTFRFAGWWMIFSYALFMVCGSVLIAIVPEDVICSSFQSRCKRKFSTAPTICEKIVQIIHLACVLILTVCSLYPAFENRYEGGVIVFFAVLLSFFACLFSIVMIGPYTFFTFRPITKADNKWMCQQKEIERAKLAQFEIKKKEREAKEEEKKRKQQEYANLLSSIGIPNKTIKLNIIDSFSDLVFFNKEKLLLYGTQPIKYSDILRYDVSTEQRKKTIPVSWQEKEEYNRKKASATATVKTSTSSMLGRAVVGGILLGGVGALAGAATAKKKVYTEQNMPEEPKPRTLTFNLYTVYVRLNDGREIEVAFNQAKEKMEQFVRELDYIITQNNQN
jgi:hypothetical protein